MASSASNDEAGTQDVCMCNTQCPKSKVNGKYMCHKKNQPARGPSGEKMPFGFPTFGFSSALSGSSGSSSSDSSGANSRRVFFFFFAKRLTVTGHPKRQTNIDIRYHFRHG